MLVQGKGTRAEACCQCRLSSKTSKRNCLKIWRKHKKERPRRGGCHLTVDFRGTWGQRCGPQGHETENRIAAMGRAGTAPPCFRSRCRKKSGPIIVAQCNRRGSASPFAYGYCMSGLCGPSWPLLRPAACSGYSTSYHARWSAAPFQNPHILLHLPLAWPPSETCRRFPLFKLGSSDCCNRECSLKQQNCLR